MDYHEVLRNACKGRTVKIVMGPPGAGKTFRTRAAHAALQNVKGGRVGYYDMSTVIEGHLRRGTPHGVIFAQNLDDQSKGRMQPDEATTLALADDISAGEHGDMLWVGYPRNPWQADVLIRSGVPFKVIELIPDENMIAFNAKARRSEGRTDDAFLDRRRSDYERTTPTYRPRLRKSATSFIPLRTNLQYLRRDVVAIIGACIGRSHPEWQNIMSSLDDPHSAPGSILLPALKQDRQRLALAA